MPSYTTFVAPDVIAENTTVIVYVAYNNDDFDNPLIYHVRPAHPDAEPTEVEMEYSMVDVRDIGYPDDGKMTVEEWVEANMDVMNMNINHLI